MTGEITYTPTEDDYAAAQRTGFIRSVRRWRVLRAWLIVLAACGIVGTFVAWGEIGVGQKLIIVGGFVAWGAIMMPLCWALTYLLIPRRSRRLFRQQRSLHSPWTYRWSDTGLENEGANGNARFAWDELHAWARTADTFLFYINDNLYLFLPTRALNEVQASELELLLTERGPTRR